MLSNIKPRIRLLVPQAKLSVIQYMTAKLIVLPHLMVVKLLKWIKI
jgi:hypothetical protein